MEDIYLAPHSEPAVISHKHKHYINMSSPQDIRLTQKYPAKEHARKVISCLKSATVVSSSSPSTSSLSLSLSVGNDTGSGADGLTGILYVEGQKSQLLEVCMGSLFLSYFLFLYTNFVCPRAAGPLWVFCIVAAM